MKKLLLVATLSIAVAAVIKRVTKHYIKLTKERSQFEHEYRALKELTSVA